MKFNPLRNIPQKALFKAGDILVVFGEVFQRGYVNGLIEEAERNGLKVIYSTVGRRDKDNQLNPLNTEELAAKEQSPLINVPLEVGFDLTADNQGQTPVDQLQGLKLKGWEEHKLNWSSIEESVENGRKDFLHRLEQYLKVLSPMIPDGANVIFAHTMAGGFPRAKIVMPAANRVFKGIDERYYSSEKFWNTDIGKLCDKSFLEVTAESFRFLIEGTEHLRSRIEGKGGKCSYVAYGYHGTEILVDSNYQWQSYSPYLQGWAKLELEKIAQDYFNKGVLASVYNAPEILTNSSSIFLGVEVCLYPLMAALEKETPGNSAIKKIKKLCEELLKEEYSFEQIIKDLNEYAKDPVITNSYSLDGWPQHNSPEQMKRMRLKSAEIIDMHKDHKKLCTEILSEVVFKSCGSIMYHNCWQPDSAVYWLGHDIVAKQASVQA